MYSAVSGLSQHQSKMDVIGNNIANVNTYGFKSSRITFADVFYQNYRNASTSSGNTGGTNASQLGYGTALGSIDVINSRGGSATTDRSLDVYINGDGYLPVQNSNGDTMYTRLGTLFFDSLGNLVDARGNKVLGIQMDENFVPQLNDDGTTTAGGLTGINVDPNYLKELTSISIGSTGQITAIEPGATSLVLAAGTNWIRSVSVAEGSLYSGAFKITSAIPTRAYLSNKAIGVTIDGLNTPKADIVSRDTSAKDLAVANEANLRNALGGDTTDRYTFTYNAADQTWNIEDANGIVVGYQVPTADLSTTYGISGDFADAQDGDNFVVEVRDSVNMKGEVTVQGDELTYTYVDEAGNKRTETIKATSTSGAAPNDVTYTFDVLSLTGGSTERTTITVTVPGSFADGNKHVLGTVTPESVKINAQTYNKAGRQIDLEGTWIAGTTNSIVSLGDISLEIDPDKLGTMNLNSLTNKQIGNIGASDGKIVTIGYIGLATFINQDGLTKVGEGYYTVSSNSGTEVISRPGNNGSGTLVSNSLEMSNVDLAAEFTEMIFAQRGFQANSRVITTSDTILEELVNLVR